jgi:RNA-directed DNA polymerase
MGKAWSSSRSTSASDWAVCNGSCKRTLISLNRCGRCRSRRRESRASFARLGIPTIYDRVCQQALLNRLEPIFEPILDDANFGYRRGRSTKDAMRKVWKEMQSGQEWMVDGDLKDFFGSVDHEKLLTLVAQRVADGRVLRLIRAMLKAGSYGKGQLFATERGTPQGGVVTPRTQKITWVRP